MYWIIAVVLFLITISMVRFISISTKYYYTHNDKETNITSNVFEGVFIFGSDNSDSKLIRRHEKLKIGEFLLVTSMSFSLVFSIAFILIVLGLFIATILRSGLFAKIMDIEIF